MVFSLMLVYFLEEWPQMVGFSESNAASVSAYNWFLSFYGHHWVPIRVTSINIIRESLDTFERLATHNRWQLPLLPYMVVMPMLGTEKLTRICSPVHRAAAEGKIPIAHICHKGMAHLHIYQSLVHISGTNSTLTKTGEWKLRKLDIIEVSVKYVKRT